jgi:uncharacterized membrane protein HdeD (DUF308 family)
MAIPLDAAAAAMREAMRETVKRYSLWYLLQGVLMVVAGVLALIYPLLASVAMVYLLAWILIVSGLLQGIGLIGARDVPHYWLQLISVVLAIVIGVLLLNQPESGLLVMTVLLIVFFMVEGISKIIFALTIRPFPNWGWGAGERHGRHRARGLSVGQHADRFGVGARHPARHHADQRGRRARLSRLEGAHELRRGAYCAVSMKRE